MQLKMSFIFVHHVLAKMIQRKASLEPIHQSTLASAHRFDRLWEFLYASGTKGTPFSVRVEKLPGRMRLRTPAQALPPERS